MITYRKGEEVGAGQSPAPCSQWGFNMWDQGGQSLSAGSQLKA